MMKIEFKVTEWETEPDPMFNPYRLNQYTAEYSGIGDVMDFLFRWIRYNTGGVAKGIQITG